MPDDSPLSLEMKVDPFDPHSRFERSVVKRLDVFPESGLAYCRCPRCVTFSSDLLQTDQRHPATRDEGQRLPVRCGVRPQSRRLSPGGQPRSSLCCSAHHLHRPSRCWPARGNQEQGVKTQCQLCKDSVQVNPPSLYRKPQFFLSNLRFAAGWQSSCEICVPLEASAVNHSHVRGFYLQQGWPSQRCASLHESVGPQCFPQQL